MKRNSKKLTDTVPATTSSNSYNKYVTKYKRTKNLIKKSVEISKQCDLDMILVIHDKNTGRWREVHTSLDLTIPDLIETLKESEESGTSLKYERIFTGNIVTIDASLDGHSDL